MESHVIKTVRRIAKGKEGQTINGIVFDLANNKSVYMDLKRTVISLENSGRLIGVRTEYITSVNHPDLVRALTLLKGGVMTGDYGWHKKGDTYTIEEGHPALTTQTHPLSGKVQVGSKVPYEQDGSHARGFMDFTVSDKQMLNETIAQAKINAERDLFAILEAAGVNTEVTPEVNQFDEPPVTIPNATAGEAFGTDPEVTE